MRRADAVARQIHIEAFPAIQPFECGFEDFDPLPMIKGHAMLDL